jgi:hypothetical protein
MKSNVIPAYIVLALTSLSSAYADGWDQIAGRAPYWGVEHMTTAEDSERVIPSFKTSVVLKDALETLNTSDPQDFGHDYVFLSHINDSCLQSAYRDRLNEADKDSKKVKSLIKQLGKEHPNFKKSFVVEKTLVLTQRDPALGSTIETQWTVSGTDSVTGKEFNATVSNVSQDCHSTRLDDVKLAKTFTSKFTEASQLAQSKANEEYAQGLVDRLVAEQGSNKHLHASGK